MNILAYNNFRQTWLTARPNAVPKKRAGAHVSRAKLIAMAIALVAINIVSGSHTIPTVAATIHSNDSTIQFIVGIAGFLSIEFTLFLMMLIPVSGKIRKLVVLLALSAAIVANLYSTTQAISNDYWTLIVGVVIGLFGPLANVAFGEVFRHEFDATRQANEQVDSEYRQALTDLDNTIRAQYTRYLKGYGITDPTTIIQYISGTIEPPVSPEIAVAVDTVPDYPSNAQPLPIALSQPDQVEPVVLSLPYSQYQPPATDSDRRVTNSGSVRTRSIAGNSRASSTNATELAELLIANSDTGLSYNAIRSKYQVGPNTISAAKKIVKDRTGQ